MSTVTLVQSADVVPVLASVVIDDVEQARELTARTREALHTAAAAVEAALALVAEARDTRAWAAMGYKTFAAYAEAELVGLRDVKLSIDRRVALVRGLVDQGLSRRGVGRIAGCSDQTVRADLDRQLDVDDEDVVEGEIVEETPAASLTQPELALAALADAGLKGLTEVEIARRYRSWKAPWAVFSRLHTQGRIARLAVYEPTGTREHKGAKHAVYVALQHLEGRDAEQPGRQRGVTLALAIQAA